MNILKKFLLILLSLIHVQNIEPDKKIGAYVNTPDPTTLQYRLGNGLGYIGNGWDDAKMANLSSLAGFDGQRKKLPEQHLVTWGYGIELGDAQTNTKLGILDVVGYLATPTLEKRLKRKKKNKVKKIDLKKKKKNIKTLKRLKK